MHVSAVFFFRSNAAHAPALPLSVCQALQHPHNVLNNDINVFF
jgi:hypothetical protein